MSLCCDQCFNDPYLKNFIHEKERKGFCDFCNADREYCVDAEELHNLFVPLVSLYKDVREILSVDELKEMEPGDFLWERLQYDWEVFNHDDEVNKKLLEAIAAADDGYGIFPLDDYVVNEEEYYTGRDAEDPESRNRWAVFCRGIREENRFFPSDDADIGKLLAKLVYRERIIDTDSRPYYRARISTRYKYSKNNMGKPPSEKARHGRGNPRGISYLYLASDNTTAIAEVKPYVGEFVTVGEFIVLESLRVVDLTTPYIRSPFEHAEDLKDVLHSMDFFKVLHEELSKPLRPKDTDYDYLPSQYVCEAIKKEGYDGVLFKSSLADGHNLLLFQDDLVSCEKTTLHKVTVIHHDADKVQDMPENQWVEQIDEVIDLLNSTIKLLNSVVFWQTKFDFKEHGTEGYDHVFKDFLMEMILSLKRIQAEGNWFQNYDVINRLVTNALFVRNHIAQWRFRHYDNKEDESDTKYQRIKMHVLRCLTKAKDKLVTLRTMTKRNM